MLLKARTGQKTHIQVMMNDGLTQFKTLRTHRRAHSGLLRAEDAVGEGEVYQAVQEHQDRRR